MRHVRLLLALAVAPLVGTACKDDVQAPNGTPIDVAVTATAFTPPVLNVEPADSIAGSEGNGLPLTVSWSIEGGQHNITFETGGAASGNLNEGATYERDFSNAQAGVYRYRCTLHSTDFTTGQVGQVVVIQ